ncbi:MAG: bifunctional oligoribonuclease/PAP phosphatase NrnA [Oscillospiraceae bacterium]
MTINECVAYLKEHDNYLIISHKRPDGDTLGSGAALCSALRRSGKTAFCLPNPETIANYLPLVAPFDAPEGYKQDVVVAVDIADLPLMPEGFCGSVQLCIDHHPSNGEYAPNLCLDETKASCGEIILQILKALELGITSTEADLLYVAISTDTGCFMYMNTNAETFRAGAELLELGADNKNLNTRLFRTMSRQRMVLEGLVLSGMRFFRGDSISVVTVTLDMMAQSGATENDCEDLAGIAGKAEGSLVSMTIRQLGENSCKVSLRSKPPVNCTEICAVYGGGGHALASGCTIDLPPEETLAAMLRAIDEKWPV